MDRTGLSLIQDRITWN